MPKQLGALILVASVAVTTAGCAPAATGGPGAGVAVPAPASATGAQPVTMAVGNSTQFAPRSVTVRAGQPVELTLRNGGGIPHDFALAGGASGTRPGPGEEGPTAVLRATGPGRGAGPPQPVPRHGEGQAARRGRSGRQPTWTAGRRSGSRSVWRSTSRVTGATSPSPKRR